MSRLLQPVANDAKRRKIKSAKRLKNFLRYVCELEIDGRAREIKEYSIGREALGRPATYLPLNDSSLRRRAASFAQSLKRSIERSCPRVRCESIYRRGPTFRCSLSVLPRERQGETLEPALALVATSEPPARLAYWLVAGALLGIFGMRFLNQTKPGSDFLREAWGPLVEQTDVLICLGTPFQMTVRPGGFSPDADLPVFPAPPGIEGLFDKTTPRRDGAKLFMRPELNTTTLGALGAVVAASNRLQSFASKAIFCPNAPPRWQASKTAM